MKNFSKVLLGATVSISTLFSVANSTSAAGIYTSQVLVSGLANPRGMVIANDGRVYLSEAGQGGNGNCVVAGSGNTVCFGTSGAVGIYDPQTSNYTRSLTEIPSLAQTNGTEGTGIQDLAFDTNGNLFGVIGLGGNPNLIADIGNPDFGKTVSINLAVPSYTILADLAAYEASNNPDQINVPPGDLNSNPYALLIHDDLTYVTDAGGNDLLDVDGTNTINTTFVFPIQQVTPPGFLPLPNPFPAQAVPTGLALGSDNALYIAKLSGFPFVNGTANIYRYDFSNPVSVFATGFSNVTDIAAGSDALYILQYSENFFSPAPSGSVWRLGLDGSRSEIFSGLNQPTGIAVGADGTIYVSNNGNGINGELLALQPVPEPLTLLGATTALGFGAFFKRRLSSPPVNRFL